MSANHSFKTTAASVDLTEDLSPSSFVQTGSVSLRDEEDAEGEDDISDDADEPAEDGSEGQRLQDGPSQAGTHRGSRLPSRSDLSEIPWSGGHRSAREEMGFHLEKILKTMEASVENQAALRKLLEDRYRTNSVQNSCCDRRVEALEGKVAALEREVEEMRSDTKVLEANVKLLMEERARDSEMTPFSSNY